MLPLSKERFSRAIEGSDRTPEADPPAGVQSPSRRISRFVVIAMIVAVGIGAGWAGGKFLNGRMNRSTAAALPGDVPAGDNSASETQPHPGASQPQPESQNAKVAETTEKPVTAEPPLPEEQPVTGSESRTREVDSKKEADSKGAPPAVPRVEKEEEAADKAAEDPAKEIGRKALKEMNNKNTNGRSWSTLNRRPWGNMNGKPSGNKNGNEERYQ